MAPRDQGLGGSVTVGRWDKGLRSLGITIVTLWNQRNFQLSICSSPHYSADVCSRTASCCWHSLPLAPPWNIFSPGWHDVLLIVLSLSPFVFFLDFSIYHLNVGVSYDPIPHLFPWISWTHFILLLPTVSLCHDLQIFIFLSPIIFFPPLGNSSCGNCKWFQPLSKSTWGGLAREGLCWTVHMLSIFLFIIFADLSF